MEPKKGLDEATVRALTDVWCSPLGMLMMQPGRPVRAAEVHALAADWLAMRAERAELLRLAVWARDELRCYSQEDESSTFQPGHRCVNCDDNVDRNMELRKALDAVLKGGER